MFYPDELRDAVDLLNRTARKLNFSFAGVLISVEGKTLVSVGNVKELNDSAELAILFREYADCIEEAEAAGIVRKEKAPPLI